MQRLILVTHGVIETEIVEYWYQILDKDLRRSLRDATPMNDASPTLAHVFTFSKRI